MIACRLERCGSSVYVQKNWSSTTDGSGGGILVEAFADVLASESGPFAAETRRCGVPSVWTADMMGG